WTARTPQAGCSHWYIASLIVCRDLRRSRPELAHALSGDLQRSIWTHIASRGRLPVRVLGIAATGAGQAKFRQTGFRLVTPAADAVDLRPRFEQVIRRRSQLRARGLSTIDRTVTPGGCIKAVAH